MPAIQVYKSGATMIPVAKAKQAKAYICPWTKEMFATKRGYVSHLKTLRINRMHRRAKELRFQSKLEDLWNQPNFGSVIRWIHLNPEVFWLSAKRNGWHSDAARWDKIRDSFEIKITSLKLTYSDMISNSHSCPHTGITNWHYDMYKDGTLKPRGYPGFGGRIEFQIDAGMTNFSSDVFKGTRIHTGSGGGGGGGKYGYDVKFFLDDWPGIARRIREERDQHEREGLLAMITDTYTQFRVPGFTYGKERR